MDNIFGFNEENLKKIGGFNTAKEIYQQPDTLKKTFSIIKDNEKKISNYLQDKLNKKDIRIIFTGAGTSAFIGEVISPYLCKKINKRVEAIHTTDIVSNPKEYLQSKVPTIIVSFARSGNSPESVATYQLAEDIIEDVYQIIITCNKSGNLAEKALENNRNLLLLMPEEVNDKGFAMTSSYTSMLLTGLMVFDMENIEDNIKKVRNIIENGNDILKSSEKEISELVKLGYDRVVYLGSGSLKGVAREASLKLLELTSGKVVTSYDSVLAFRHGPKSIINDRTIVIMFLSSNEYTSQYDMDLIKEISKDAGNKKLIAITNKNSEVLSGLTDKVFTSNNELEDVEDAYLALEHIIYAQIFAFLYSIKLGISPDNPRPDGTVNRVVQGVVTYKFS